MNFTVNITLIERKEPVIGVVYATVFEVCDFAPSRNSIFRQVVDETLTPIQKRKMEKDLFSVLLGQYLGSSTRVI
ncbi:hypothetical protein [Coxiella endosymbiont of Ornithodoros amblus]|uniref:hypothetical protein n=1 Tax=Coxiella endosymbiont of Ornithodoros amblus TaxID=1656166 RepID=UPI00244E13F5|nr:hypothetical protein [Coxiella endosymbiont of Ornithodoros amblus]